MYTGELCVIVIMGIITSIYVYFKLKRPGTSPELKQNITRRHLEYVLIFTLLEIPIVSISKPSLRTFQIMHEG